MKGPCNLTLYTHGLLHLYRQSISTDLIILKQSIQTSIQVFKNK